MSDIHSTEEYVDDKGNAYRIEFHYDDTYSLADLGDGFGVVVDDIDFDIEDLQTLGEYIEENEIDFEGETRLRMMRVLRRGGRNHHYVCYDFLGSLQAAKRDGWRSTKLLGTNATDEQHILQCVEDDFRYLYGYYNDEWCFLYVRVIPYMDGELMPDLANCVGGFESTFLDDEEEKASWLRQLTHEVAHNVHTYIHRHQLSLLP